jgi:hypothetical protein
MEHHRRRPGGTRLSTTHSRTSGRERAAEQVDRVRRERREGRRRAAGSLATELPDERRRIVGRGDLGARDGALVLQSTGSHDGQQIRHRCSHRTATTRSLRRRTPAVSPRPGKRHGRPGQRCRSR